MPDDAQVTRSSRDRRLLRERLQDWARERTGDRSAIVERVVVPDTNGMSSETLLADALVDGMPQRWAVRVAPAAEDVPVFPSYDMERQYRVMALVRSSTDAPVPEVFWSEPDPAVLGGAFFVMERVDGRVPPDVMPYTMEGWLVDAEPADRAALARRTLSLLAELHTVTPADHHLGFLTEDGAGSALRRHVDWWRRYYDWMREGGRIPLIERAFDWLDRHWPADESDGVLSWGDARIGNVIYDGFEPVALLDWEMAGLAPPGVDLGWTRFMHVFFQDIAETMGSPGLPGLFDRDPVVDAYESAGGTAPVALDFYDVYAALRHAVVMARIHARQVHFGVAEVPEDPDELIMHRSRLERMLDGEPLP